MGGGYYLLMNEPAAEMWKFLPYIVRSYPAVAASEGPCPDVRTSGCARPQLHAGPVKKTKSA